MQVVDFHAHFCSRTFFDALADLSSRPGEREEKLAEVTERTGIELPEPGAERHLERWRKEMERHEVAHMLVFAGVTEELPVVASAVRASKGLLSGCAIVNPRQPGCEEEVWSLLTEQGFRALLLFPALDNFRLSGPEAEGALRVADDQEAVVFVHCGLLLARLRDLLRLPQPIDYTFANPLDVISVANRYPQAKFVIPHFGSGFFRETLMAGAQCENIYVDTSSTHSWLRTQPFPLSLEQAFQRALDIFGARRILFGTDSCTFPRGWRADRFGEQKRTLDSLELSAPKQALIFGGNALSLLGRDSAGRRVAEA